MNLYNKDTTGNCSAYGGVLTESLDVYMPMQGDLNGVEQWYPVKRWLRFGGVLEQRFATAIIVAANILPNNLPIKLCV